MGADHSRELHRALQSGLRELVKGRLPLRLLNPEVPRPRRRQAVQRVRRAAHRGARRTARKRAPSRTTKRLAGRGGEVVVTHHEDGERGHRSDDHTDHRWAPRTLPGRRLPSTVEPVAVLRLISGHHIGML